MLDALRRRKRPRTLEKLMRELFESPASSKMRFEKAKEEFEELLKRMGSPPKS
jgi:hypothetical protein